MKNQNDLIFSIVAILVFLIVAGVAFGTKKQPTQPSPPAQVPTTPVALPAGVKPTMANALPGGSASGGGAGAGRMGGGAAAGGAPGQMQVSLSGASSPGGGGKPGFSGVSLGR